jgi:hypothetical protein
MLLIQALRLAFNAVCAEFPAIALIVDADRYLNFMNRDGADPRVKNCRWSDAFIVTGLLTSISNARSK